MLGDSSGLRYHGASFFESADVVNGEVKDGEDILAGDGKARDVKALASVWPLVHLSDLANMMQYIFAI